MSAEPDWLAPVGSTCSAKLGQLSVTLPLKNLMSALLPVLRRRVALLASACLRDWAETGRDSASILFYGQNVPDNGWIRRPSWLLLAGREYSVVPTFGLHG